jgi:hypothetical protein
MTKERAMQEQIVGQLVQQLQERAGLDQEKATQVAGVVFEFLQQHSGEILKMVAAGGGGGDIMGQVGKLFGR